MVKQITPGVTADAGSRAERDTAFRTAISNGLRIAAMSVALLTAAGTVRAQSSEGRSVLVLDASGSMWGQIEGEAKITIAQRAIGELLETLPDDEVLGLVAYGHRRKGDCDDIETLVEPATGARERIRSAVNAISPKGKTPLSASVLAAAERLKYEEERSTVILVSDGLETCGMDPCAVGEQLEATGVDFTAHVVGFDVDDEARAQLACLAERTGGRFLAAGDASELSEALLTITAPTAPVEVTFVAEISGTGQQIDTGLVWTLTDLGSDEALVENALEPSIVRELPPGTYRADVLWTDLEAYAEAELAVEAGDDSRRVALVFEAPQPEASLDAPPSAVAGAEIEVAWTGPDAEGDYLAVFPPDGNYTAYTYTEEGSPLQLLMPADPGNYEIRYIMREGLQTLAAVSIVVEPVSAAVEAPPSASAGETIEVAWTGPGYEKDYVTVARPDTPGGKYETYTYVEEGSPLSLQLPGGPGDYEIRYIQRQGAKVLASRPISVEAVDATLSAPPTAGTGSVIEVAWTGPAQERDYISVAEPGAQGSSYANYVFVEKGSPAPLTMPAEPGEYELRYIQRQDSVIVTSIPITVTAAEARLEVPPSAPAGSVAEIVWEGPDNEKDFLTVAEPGMSDGEYVNYVYTEEGSPASLQMPGVPGDYEIRYIQREGHRAIAREPISVAPVEAKLAAPPSVAAGGALQLAWQGPNYAGDYISIAEASAPGGSYEAYIYTREGSSGEIQAPETPGDYELRYVISEGNTIVARAPLTVTAP